MSSSRHCGLNGHLLEWRRFFSLVLSKVDAILGVILIVCHSLVVNVIERGRIGGASAGKTRGIGCVD